MDVQMPEMDGIAATEKIRALPGDRSRIPIVAMTVNALKGDDELSQDSMDALAAVLDSLDATG